MFGGYEMLGRGIFSDLIRANLPTYYMMFDHLGKGFWSWNMGIGTSILTHADAIFDPFTYICFLFGRDYIPQMIVWCFVVKLIFGAIAFFFYLRYFHIHPASIFIGSLLYAMNGYFMIMGTNLALGTIMVYLPIVLLGLEKFIKENKIAVLLAGLWLTAVYFYYYFYMCGVISAVYLLMRIWGSGEKNWKVYAKKIGKLAVVGGIVILLASFVLFSQIRIALDNPRVGDNSDTPFGWKLLLPSFYALTAAVGRLFGSNMLGGPYLPDGYLQVHWDYFQLAPVLSGTFLLFLAQYIYYAKKNRKLVITTTVLIATATLFKIFSYILNAFSTLNFRWYFIVSALQALAMALGINEVIKHKGFHKRTLFLSIGWSYAILFITLVFQSVIINPRHIFTSLGKMARSCWRSLLVMTAAIAGVVAVHLVTSFFEKRKKDLDKNELPDRQFREKEEKQRKKIVWIGGVRHSAVAVISAAVICLECWGNYGAWFSNKGSIQDYGNSDEPYSSYEDESLDLIRELQARDGGFYRINKDFDSVRDYSDIPSENDAMAQNYFGLKCYNSANNSSYIEFLQTLGIYCAIESSIPEYIKQGILPEEVTGSQLNYINGVYDRYDLMSYLGVKYFISEEEEISLPSNFLKLKEENGLTVYENLAALPLAFVNTPVVAYEDFIKLDDEDKDYVLLNATVVREETLKAYGMEASSIRSYTEEETLENALQKKSAFELLSFSNDLVRFKIHVENEKEWLSFSIPYDRDWTVYVDGKKVSTEKINISLLGALISKGEHIVELKYRPKAVYLGLGVSVFTMVAGSIAVVISSRGKNKKRKQSI